MSFSEWLQLGTLITVIVTAGFMPIIMMIQRRGQETRDAQTRELHARLDHLDQCFDTVKLTMLGTTATKTEMADYRAELNVTVSRIREAVSNEIAGVRDMLAGQVQGMEGRLFRLESRFLGGRESD